jgi:hypothetical protein
MNPAEFERDISRQIMSQDVTDVDAGKLIADALNHNHTHGTKRRIALHIHLRLKNGAGASEVPMNRHELVDLAEMVATDCAIHDIIKRLANFYVRIAHLRARIMASETDEAITNTDVNINSIRNIERLQSAYATNERTMHEKRNENQRELTRIMQALFLDSDIHPNLTEGDLPALEMQVDRIIGRGYVAQELRRLKILEAALAQQKYDAIIAELNALDR